MEPPPKIARLDDSQDLALNNPNPDENNSEASSESSIDDSDSTSISDDFDWNNGGLQAKEDSNSSFADELFSNADETDTTDTFSELYDDPLSNISGGVIGLVLQHLTGHEIKTATEVSKNWSRKLAKCEELTTKHLKLNIDVESPSSCSNLLALLKSRRTYKDVNISINNDKEVEKIADSILRKFGNSIVNLKILKIGGHNSFLKKPLSLNRLESLELNIVCGRISCPLEDISMLKKLSVNGFDPRQFLATLQKTPCLEQLLLYENSFISYFDQDMSPNLPFRLKKLGIYDHFNTKLVLCREFPAEIWDNKARINFMKFINVQSIELKSLHMDSCASEDLKKILKMLPALEILEVNRLTGDLSKLKLMNNKKITTFIATKVIDQLLNEVIANFPNLKSIFIGNVKTHQFFNIIRNAKRLEKFCYFWAAKSEKIHGSFINLKKFYQQTESIESVIDFQIMKKETFIGMIEL